MPKKPAPVFAYHDEYWLEDSKPNPLAVAARVLQFVDYHHGTAKERGEDDDWITYGIADAASALARHGEYNALGLLFTALESLVPAHDRAKWPLAEPEEACRGPLSPIEEEVRDIVENGDHDDDEDGEQEATA